MQLKICRSQRQGGVVSKNVLFCLDARVEFTPEEKQSVVRYKLQNEVLYNSEAQLRLLDKSRAQQDGSIGGSLKSLATAAFAHTKLYITISSLEKGQHIECKSLDELIGAEEALLAACQNLKSYLDTALTFDGREVLVAFETGVPTVIAETVTPQPMLVAPTAQPGATQPLIAGPSPVADGLPAHMVANTSAWEEALDRKAREFFESLKYEPAKRYAALAVGALLLIFFVRSCAG